ncbi:putative baseplate assembly protein [Kitasatospora mediocidica]|uniref:putative baseplate assembly protein n=1 Tax=Kitasatospora mediocidica TaxID=58352 RepID=UPI000562C8D9|nr:putative baseplate assembly protein [Kitasatospora mediocidica]
MSLPAPDLDDRRFQDLVDDAKRLVMRRCPEWTDHNVSDPGVTLIETFAYMTDQLLYRLNRVPDRLYLKFLDMLGITLLPPTAARVPLTFWLAGPATTALSLPIATAAATLRGDTQEPVVFSTTEVLQLPACRLDHLMTLHTAVGELQPRDEHLRLEISFPAFGDGRPGPGDALLVGLSDPAPRCLVRIDLECHIQGIGVDPDHPPLRWEAWDGLAWAACELQQDDTGGLNRPGSVVLQLPDRHEASVLDGRRAGWLRAVVVPAVDDLPGYSASPVIDAMSACVVGGTVPAVHAELVGEDVIGTAEGVPGQRLSLSQAPVVLSAAEPILETSSADGWEAWSRVDHFAASGPEDRHFVLDATTGTVRFGPAVREADGTLRLYGATPRRDCTVRVRRYAIGGGRDGNVEAGAIQSLKTSVPFVGKVENLRPAQGGVDGESVAEVRDRAPLLLRTRDRAVTAEDYEVIARQAAPEIGRIRCLPAGTDGVPAGTVKLLVVPAAQARDARVAFEELVPPREMLERIAARLDATRPIGTTVVVEPPLYRGVTVVARVRATLGAGAARVTADVTQALHAFINPITGGPDGNGWPFGRPVQSGDLFAVVHSVPGVELIEEIRLYGANPVTGERGEQTDRLEVAPNSLAFSFEHHIKVEERQ